MGETMVDRIDREKVVHALEKALLKENKIGLVLQQLQARTGLSREKTKIALIELINENVIVDSNLTSDDNNSSRKIYLLREGLEAMKDAYENREARIYA